MPNERVRRALAEIARTGYEVFGLDLVRAGVASRTWLYILLSQMEADGLIASRLEDGDDNDPGRRRLYRITDAGRGVLLPTVRVR